MAKGLTKRQAEILDFIIHSIRDRGMPPTIAETGREFGISSTNAVNDHLVALEKKGYITRSSKARSIQVTEKASAGLYATEVSMVPVIGQIAAGMPVLATENVETHIPVSTMETRSATFALRVRGDSMIEDGILDGDIIIVDGDATPKKGDIVVALVEDEATVKRYFRHGDTVELRPANAAMEPILVPARSVRLQGVVVALHRAIH